MRTILLAVSAATLLIAAAPIRLAPADDKPAQPIGAAARTKNGPEPLARPPEDVGSAEDPAPITLPPSPPHPPKP